MPTSSKTFFSPKKTTASLVHYSETNIVLKNSNIYISAIPKTGNEYKLYRSKHSKGNRIKLLQQELNYTIKYFIDNDPQNIQSVQASAKEISTLHYTQELTNQEIREICQTQTPSNTLAIDFDETITKHHTIHTTYKGTKTPISALITRNQNNYNPSILNLMQQWPGDIIIFTDHNNIEFIEAFLTYLASLPNQESQDLISEKETKEEGADKTSGRLCSF